MADTVKVTSHGIRSYDKYDIELKNWRAAGLTLPSVARISKVIYISKDRFRRRVGMLHPEDAKNVLNTYDKFIQELKSIAKDAARETADEETIDKKFTDDKIAGEEATNMESTIEETTNEKSIDEESVNEKFTNKEPATEESTDEESVNKVSSKDVRSSIFVDKERRN